MGGTNTTETGVALILCYAALIYGARAVSRVVDAAGHERRYSEPATGLYQRAGINFVAAIVFGLAGAAVVFWS